MVFVASAMMSLKAVCHETGEGDPGISASPASIYDRKGRFLGEVTLPSS